MVKRRDLSGSGDASSVDNQSCRHKARVGYVPSNGDDAAAHVVIDVTGYYTSLDSVTVAVDI